MTATILTPQQISNERMATMGRVFAKADRVLSAQPVTCSIVEDTYNSAPAWSNGADITFNMAHVGSVTSVDDIIKVTGLNYHELSHVLFTPRNKTSLVKSIIADGNFRYFNMLEDQRIETLMVAKYPSTKPFFVACFMRYLLANKDQWTRVFPLAHGRKYLPKDARRQTRVRYADQSIVADLAKVIDEYRLLAFPRDDQRGLELVREFARLLQSSQQDATPTGDPNGHAQGTRPQVTEGAPEDHTKTAAKAAKQDDEDPDEQPGGGDDEASDAMGKAQAEEDGDDNDTEDDDDADGSGSGSGDEDDDFDGDDDADSDEDGAGSDGDDDDTEDPDWDDDDVADGDVGGDQKAGSQDGGDEAADGDQGGEQDSDDGAKGNGAGAGDSEQPAMPDDDFEDLLRNSAEKAEATPEVQQDAKAKQDSIVKGDGDTLTNLDAQSYVSSPVPGDLLATARRFGKELARLRDDIDPGWHREQSSGRLNVGRAMRGDDLDTVWDRWDEGHNEAADIEAVIMLDYSDSMSAMMNDASMAMWAIKRSFEEVGGKVTVIGYSDGATLMYDGTQKVERTTFKRFAADGGTQPRKALDQAMRVLHNSRRKSKYLISITDGAWWSEESARIDRMNKAGVVTGMVYLLQPYQAVQIDRGLATTDSFAGGVEWQGHTVRTVARTAHDLAPFAVGLVKARLRQARR